MSKRVLIVGGVAGGAACAARLRRMDEQAEIVIFDRGSFVSFANCGLPYFIGGVIEKEKSLLVADEKLFKDRFNIDVHTETEVVAIDREKKTVSVIDRRSGRARVEAYDALVLSPGASPFRPPVEGIDLPGVFSLRTIPDSREIRQWLDEREVKNAVVIGGGFIGLEMAENLTHRGVQVTIVEMLDQVMPPFDGEMASLVAEQLTQKGVQLALGDGLKSIRQTDSGALVVHTQSGRHHEAGIVILAIGVRPETSLAVEAGLELGSRGGIRVDEHMRTSDPSIWAVGDAVEVRDYVTGQPALVPLAGPAARQGRIAADNICGREARFRGVQGTAICGVFDLEVACTGASEKTLRRLGATDFEKIYLHPNDHAGYYPGATGISLKLLFRPSDGRLLGAQGVGVKGVARRIDVIAMAIQMAGTIYDLEEAELCYAPQFGGAKDAANFAGMIAADVVRGDMPITHWTEPATAETVLLDVRSPGEFANGHAPGAVNYPLETLRDSLARVPASPDLRVYCAVGQRGYVATRLLRQNGIPARNLSGGLTTGKRLLAVTKD